MEFIHGYNQYRKSGSEAPLALAIGMFDGYHLGHREVVRMAARLADASHPKGISAAFTFNVHPSSVVRPDRTPKLIYPLAKKIECLESAGIDYACVVDFTEELCRLSAEDFVISLTKAFPNLQHICVGRDFGFGHRRLGDVSLLQSIGPALGFRVHEIPAVKVNGTNVSSTHIRKLLSTGKLNEAEAMIGRKPSISGIVAEGRRLGRTIGVPTANIDVDGLCLPPFGVYAGLTRVQNQQYPSVMNLGVRPSVKDSQSSPNVANAEIHILNFSEDLYGESLEFTLMDFLRPEKKFDSLDLLKKQIQIDIQSTSRFFDS